MTPNIFGRLAASPQSTRSFYEQLRSRDEEAEEDIEHQAGLNIDDENLRQHLDELDAGNLGNSRLSVASAVPGAEQRNTNDRPRSPVPRWKAHDEDMDNDVPASLLVEHHSHEPAAPPRSPGTSHRTQHRSHRPVAASPSTGRRAQWEAAAAQQPLHGTGQGRPADAQPRSLLSGKSPAGAKEKAMWRWVNTSNIDSFMRDIYDYFEGGGLWCILTSNALWLL